ncbi:Integral membrane protein TerC family protein [Pirellulimonas nuda]|uniref:Integral membrane protein TerC family protein n=1 Tax=Pirellulimonas nuda TaxID=2528009 RepID=A0A518D9P0_9BACT|nr:TerC family protein [Pirellulimonas nuda]QDU88200.1 Integral membrane protein TerC family protein [Pirellulimonas nuda]
MAELLAPGALIAMLTLTILEIVLGIDNIVFLAILTGKLPPEQQPKARTLGLLLAAVGRIGLLMAITWVITLDKTVLFTLPFSVEQSSAGAHGPAPEPESSTETDEDEPLIDLEHGTPITVKDLVLLLGGLFLIGKATWEIGHQVDGHGRSKEKKAYASLSSVLAQIVLIDLVFSIDSVLTAVGMVRPEDYSAFWVPLTIMSTAVLLAIAVMLIFSGPIARFVNENPSVKMLALAFLILIGVVLVAESLHTHIPRGYIYFAMAFSLGVEMLNLRAEKKARLAESHA